MSVFGISKQTLKLFTMGLLWDAYDREQRGRREKDSPSPKPVTLKKLGTVIPQLKIKKIHKLHDTPLEFC